MRVNLRPGENVARSQIDNIQAKDSEFAYQSELDQVKDNNSIPQEFIAADMNNWELWKRIVGVNNRANDSNPVFFNPSGADYLECNSSTYEVRADLIYRGSAVWVPTTLILLVGRSAAAGAGFFRIYDFTHSQIICERSFTNTAKQINKYELTPTEKSFFSAETSVLEFQLRRDGNSKVYLYAAGLYTE